MNFQSLSQVFPSLPIWLTALLLMLPAVLNLWSIWHAMRNRFATVQEQMIWVATSVFVPVLGGIAYIIFGRRRVMTKSQIAALDGN